MLDVCLLGTSGMMPLPNRYLTSLALRCNGKMILIDCGEGTQVTLKMLGWGFKAIDAICFTHYHGDHISGLPGLLLTIGNSGREDPLILIGPPGLVRVVEGLRVIAPDLPFKIQYIEISHKERSKQLVGEFQISTLPVDHMIPCLAYSIEILRKSKFEPERAISQQIPKVFWNKLQKGETIQTENGIYTPDMVLGEPRKGLKISYCTDSRPTAVLPEFIFESDLFICEGMYGEEEKKEKAIANKHMLFSEAACLAKAGAVNELWLTHFSPALTRPEDFLEETRKIFKNTCVGRDRMTKTLLFQES